MEPYRLKHKKSFKIKNKRSFLKSRLFWLPALVFLFFGGFAYSAYYFKLFEIKEVSISGNQKVKTEELASFMEEKAKSRILFFETKNIFLADFEKIKQEALRKFLLISKIEMQKHFSGNISVSVKEREPAGVLCSLTQCYFFDSEGVAFEKTEQTLPVLVRVSSDIALGNKELDGNDVKAILEIERMLRDNFSIQTKEFFLDKNKLEAITSEGWRAVLRLGSDTNSEIFNLKAVLEEEVLAAKRAELDYIDLRFGNKVFYK